MDIETMINRIKTWSIIALIGIVLLIAFYYVKYEYEKSEYIFWYTCEHVYEGRVVNKEGVKECLAGVNKAPAYTPKNR